MQLPKTLIVTKTQLNKLWVFLLLSVLCCHRHTLQRDGPPPRLKPSPVSCFFMCCWSEGPSESRLNTSFISVSKTPFLPAGSAHDFTTSDDSPQADDLACLWPPLAQNPGQSRWFPLCLGPRQTGCCGSNRRRDRWVLFLRFGDLGPSEEDGGGLTCPGWRWRSWLCRPSGLIWSPPRSRSCIAAPRHPNREEQGALGQLGGGAQSRAPLPTVPSAFCPRWACAGQILHRWENSQRYLQERKSAP